MYLSDFPYISLGDLFGSRRSVKGMLTGRPDRKALCYFYCRSAIYHAAKAICGESTGVFLVPEYHCGVEIEAILRGGGAVRYYRLDGSLNADVSDMESKICEKTRAVFIIHYFGFPQDVDKVSALCQKHGILLMQDCAHSFLTRYGGVPLGNYGDCSFYSFHKLVPVTSMGAVLCSGKVNIELIPGRPPDLLSEGRLVYSHLKRNIKSRSVVIARAFGLLENFLRVWFKRLKERSGEAILHSGDVDFDSKTVETGPSRLAVRLIERLRVADVERARTENFLYLLNRIPDMGNVAPVRDELPGGTVPCFMPVRVGDRGKARRRLMDAGIETFIFGDQLHRSLTGEDRDRACRNTADILCLPIHEKLGVRHMEHLCDALRSLNA